MVLDATRATGVNGPPRIDVADVCGLRIVASGLTRLADELRILPAVLGSPVSPESRRVARVAQVDKIPGGR